MRKIIRTFADLHFNLRQASGKGKGLMLDWTEVSNLVQQLNREQK